MQHKQKALDLIIKCFFVIFIIRFIPICKLGFQPNKSIKAALNRERNILQGGVPTPPCKSIINVGVETPTYILY